MVYNYFISILIITCSLLIIPIPFSMEEDTELYHICLTNTRNFTIANNQSRALVLIDLIINTASSPNEGFRNASHAWPLEDPDERIYGLALCRGDVSTDECHTCVNNASQTVTDTDHCPDSRSAIIWRDYCFLKYSDVDFFEEIDTENMFSSMGSNTWSRTAYVTAVDNLMASLSKTAMQSPKLNAFGTSNITDDHINVTVYGVAQCTRDISPRDCNDCLNCARNSLATRQQGARILFGSCNIRYEIYNFNSSAIS